MGIIFLFTILHFATVKGSTKKLLKLTKVKGKDFFVKIFVSPNCLWFSAFHHLALPLHHLNLHHCPTQVALGPKEVRKELCLMASNEVHLESI